MIDILYEISDISIKISSLAIKSLIYEFNHFPSLGLVCASSNGSHDDMDVFTFIDSTSSLIKPFILCAEAGFKRNSLEALFKEIREIGILGEKDMFISTKGVNTHKGTLFILGILCAATTRCLYENRDFLYIRSIVKSMTKDLSKLELELLNKDKKDLTHGEEIYNKYRIKGIREEAERGFPIIFESALDAYSKSKSKNDRLVYTLISIIKHCTDTNIIYRCGIDCLLDVQNKAKRIIKAYDVSDELYKKSVEEFNNYLIENKISPGGSADILSATIFLHEIREKFFKISR
ncbi:MAG: triphosphoribosyl-dephospho-CoA synthase [Oscillospiraceae bacterium]|nr:triphosphoribosyl-dephospho-CoA synthase [Oscillospiraceae bacterium]